MKEEEKKQLLDTLADAAKSETLEQGEMEAVAGGALDNKCVHNTASQCGCSVKPADHTVISD